MTELTTFQPPAPAADPGAAGSILLLTAATRRLAVDAAAVPA